MQRTVTLITCTFLLLIAGCTGRGDAAREAQVTDSIVSEAVTNSLVAGNAEWALAIVDSAEAAGGLGHFDAELFRAKVYRFDESTMDTARTLCKKLLEKSGLSPKQKAEVLDVLVYVSRMKQDDDGLLNYGMQYIEVCQQMGETVCALGTQTEMGNALIRLGRSDEGMAKIDDAIAQLDRVHRFNETDACIRAMKSKIRTLNDLGRYAEVIPVAERMVEKLNDYGQHPADYDDGALNQPTDERRPGYIDFYTGQAYAFMAYAYAMQGTSLNQSNNQAITQSKRCLALFEQTNYSKTPNGRKLISSTWCQLGMYDKMLAFYDELDAKWGSDTLHSDYAIMLLNRATAARAQGNYRASDAYMQRYANLLKTLNDSERLATAQEYAARYHEQEQQAALLKAQAARRNMGTIAILLGLIVIGLTVVVVILIRQRRDIRQKNAVLTREITERIEYEELYRQLATTSLTPDPSPSEEESEVQGVSTPLSARRGAGGEACELGEAALFELLSRIIKDEHLYLDPLFGRESLESRFRISKERLGAAFAKGSPYGSIQGFLGEVRLQHAAKLLAEQPDLPIADVATQSGFASYVVFARNFKQRFALTPTDFRKKNA